MSNAGFPRLAPISRQTGVLTASVALLECMRPAQWIKNGFVLAPLLFSAHFGDAGLAFRGFVAFTVFCLSASGIYLWNDSLDWKSDLNHPEKRTRPIPSGRLSTLAAIVWGTMLIALSVAGAFALNRQTGLLVSSYIILNAVYSLNLKHVAIMDLMCIAMGFVFRVMTGATAIQVQPSHWLLMCTFLIALFLGIAKRRQEIVTLEERSEKHRRVLVNYKLSWLDQAGTLVSGATLVAYALYTVSPETQARFGTDRLIYTLPFVVYGVLRYLYLMHNGQTTDNPTRALIADKQLLCCVMIWVLACCFIIYF